MAEILRYVDPNAAAGGDGTQQVLSGSTCAYQSLNAWEAATQQDLTDGGGDTARVVCSSNLDAGSGSADTTDVTVDGWTTGVNNYITIEAESSHGGKWNSSIYRLALTGDPYAYIVTINEASTRITGLQVDCSGASNHCYGIILSSDAAGAIVKNTIAKGQRLADAAYGNFVSLCTSAVYFINCISYDAQGCGFLEAAGSATCFYNCTSIDNNYGFRADYYGPIFRNCLGHSNTTADFYGNITAGNITYCASSDTTADDWGGTGNRISQTFTFNNEGSDDFHLASNDTGAKDQGTRLHLSATNPFLDDAEGKIRRYAWDIGALEYGAGTDRIITSYVDKDAAASGNGSSNSLSGTNCAYQSLNAWEAAQQANITTQAGGYVSQVICCSNHANHTADSTSVSIDGWTSDSSRYIQVEAETSHGGSWNNSAYRIVVNNQWIASGIIGLVEDFVRIYGLQLYNSNTASGEKRVVRFFGSNSANYTLAKCILKADQPDLSSTLVALYGVPTGATYNLYNNLIYGFKYGITFAYNVTGIFNIMNNTIIDCLDEGIDIGRDSPPAGTLNLYNNLVQGSGIYDYWYTSANFSVFNHATNISEDTSSPDTSFRQKSVVFANEGSKDYHLGSSDTEAKDKGTSNPGSGLFADDIDGVTRTGTWDIGADEYVASGVLAGVGLTDSAFIQQTFGRVVSDSLGLTDSTLSDIVSGIIAVAISEAIGTADSLSRVFTALRTISDNAGVTDSPAFTKIMVRAVAEAVGLTDSQTSGMALSRIVSDSTGISDALAKLVAKMMVVSESLGITDYQLRRIDYIRREYENAGVTDSAQRKATFARTAIDNLGVTDAARKFSTMPRIISESLGLTDSRYQQIILNIWTRTVSDSVGATDFIAKLIGRGRTVADQCGVTDARVIRKTMLRVLSEALSIVDSVYRRGDWKHYQTESVGPADARTTGLAYIRRLTEQMGTTDAIKTYALLIILRSIYNSVGVTDARTPIKSVRRDVTNTLGITDSQKRLLASVRQVANDLGITDFDATYKQMVRTLGEDVWITEDRQKLLAYVREISESYGIEDSLIAGLLKLRTIFDSVGISDADTWRILTALYLSIALGLYDQFVLLTSKSKRITVECKDSRITLEAET